MGGWNHHLPVLPAPLIPKGGSDRKPGMSLNIHLGAHKTATTHLQRCLGAIEADLLAHELMFLGPDTLRGAPLDLRALLNNPDRHPKRRDAARTLLRGLRAEHRDLLISEELILGGLGQRLLGPEGRIYQDAGQRLRNLLTLLGNPDVTLFLALRSPADFLTSLFGEQMRHGGPVRIEDFLDGFDPVSLSWSDLVARLLKGSQAGRIVCWRYEDTAAIRPVLLTRLLGSDLAARVPDLPPVRVGMSAAAYQMVLEKAGQGEGVKMLTNRALNAHPREGGEARMQLLSPAVHKQCEHAYDDDCRNVAAMARVEFLRPASQG